MSVSFIFSVMEEEELQVALAISASLIDHKSSCHQIGESSRLAPSTIYNIYNNEVVWKLHTYVKLY